MHRAGMAPPCWLAGQAAGQRPISESYPVVSQGQWLEQTFLLSALPLLAFSMFVHSAVLSVTCGVIAFFQMSKRRHREDK